MRKRYEEAGAELEILSAGTTGYGEMLFSKAFEIPCHTVETVAHARASEKYVKDASFILDIGGFNFKFNTAVSHRTDIHQHSGSTATVDYTRHG